MNRLEGKKSLALIGFGAIGEEVLRCLEIRGEASDLLGVLDLKDKLPEVAHRAAGRFQALDRIEALLDLRPDIVLECAGHSAVRHFGPRVLGRGIDLMIASVGVLADEAVTAQLVNAAQGGAQVWVPSGAVAGMDGLLAARTAGLRSVIYTSIKPPLSWKGTRAEGLLAGHEGERIVFFEASAREAALHYPQNANVGATVALAGIGLDRTLVRLVSDPAASGPLGIIEAEGDFGKFRFEILAYASPMNPKTSTITAHSMVMAVRQGMCFSVTPAAA